MKKAILYAVMLCGAASASAQTTVSPNEAYNKSLDMTGGRFEYKLNEREAVNVNYSLSPKHPVDIAQFSLHTPDPMPFRADIVNASGKVVFNWKPETQVYLYNASWNLSKLGKGEYTVRIYLEGQKNSIYQFAFSKE